MTAAAPQGRRLYVYYKAAAANLPAVQRAARAMQAELIARYPGLRAELLRRPSATTAANTAANTAATTAANTAANTAAPSDGTITEAATAAVTLMEIYDHPSGVDDALADDIEREAQCLRSWLQGGRHVEVFEALGAA